MYEFTGTVKRVGATRTFASGFTSRELIVVEERSSSAPPTEWQNVVSFAFKRANGQLLDSVQAGDHVKICFVVDGREWTNPQTQELRCFSNLTALRLEKIGAPAKPAASSEDTADSEEEYPF